MCYQATKHTNIQTDPLDAIQDHIKNNPQSYSKKTTHNNNNDSQDIHSKQGAKSNSQGTRQEHMEKLSNETWVNNDNIKEGENIVKTRYGRIVRKPDRLMYP